MTILDVDIRPFNPRDASEREFVGRSDFYNRLLAEQMPLFPPVSAEERKAGWQNMPAFIEGDYWNIWDALGLAVVASAYVNFARLPENRHVIEFDIAILPEYRRQGLARRLLERVVALPQREGRRLMIGWTNSRIPAGEAFMRRIGAQQGLIERTSVLEVADLNRELMCQWQEQAQQSASDFELGLWDGSYPEADLAAVAALVDVMNTAPRGALELEDEHTTPEQLRQRQQQRLARGQILWTLYARHMPSGELAGFTEVVWNPRRPEIVMQGGTGVWPKYRNKGLGRWLKAAMIEKVLRERPSVKRFVTGNAQTNAPMLKINVEMGFKPYHAEYAWQIETERVLHYLAGRR